MDFRLAIERHDVLAVHLRDGVRETTVTVHPSRAGIQSLSRALDDAIASGYGECFWPGMPGGQYWWIFKREADTLETIAMWTRGGAALWEHVFRATDAAGWVRERMNDEIGRLAQSDPRATDHH
jgi:hypothetical protein